MAGSLSLKENLAKAFGEATVSSLGELKEYTGFLTGLPQFDKLLDGVGIPKGKLVQIAGSEGSGKSTLALQLVAKVQRDGGTCVYVDLEHTLHVGYATSLGVDVENLIVVQPMDGEDALNALEMIVQDGSVDLVVFDSVGQIIVKREIEGDLLDADVGIRAKVLAKAVRRIAPVANKNDTTVLFINQLRDNVGAMGAQKRTMSPGGRTYKHDLSLELDLTRATAIKQGEDEIGFVAKLKIAKSKLSASRQQVDLAFYYYDGFDVEANVLQAAIDVGIVQKAGPWLKWAESGESFAQGFEKARQLLKEDRELFESLYTQV